MTRETRYSQTRYGAVAQSLHWASAFLIFALLAVGWTMTDLPPGSAQQFKLFQLHKSLGVTVFALTLIRLVWRLRHGVPALPATMPLWERRAAGLGHLGLYALAFGLPLTGWAVVSSSPFNIPTLLYGVIPLPHLWFLAEATDKKALSHLLGDVHAAAAFGLVGLLAVHVGAALRHHIWLKDDVLRRMLPRSIGLGVALTAGLTLALSWAVPAQAAAVHWQIDPAKSQLGFAGSQSGMAFSGQFKRWSGSIDFDPANPAAGHALIEIDMGSVATGDAQKDGALPQSDWFDVKAFPKAQFEAKSFTSKGGNAYEARGALTIRGHAKEVILPFTLDVSGNHAHAKGHLELVRTEWGVGQGEYASGQYVALPVSVTFDLTASSAP